MPAPHIAVVDDEPDITQLLAMYLSTHGMRVSVAASGAELDALMARDRPDLVLLDLGLPGEDGLAVARRLRGGGPIGLIIVTGRGDAVDKVVGLEIGADDYVTKPFDLRELLARVKAVLRRIVGDPAAGTGAPVALPAAAPAASAPPAAPAGAGELLCFAGWTVDRGARRVLHDSGREVLLTAGEFDLLLVLAGHAGRVLSRDFLLEETRGRSAAPFDRTVDVQVGRIRRKFEQADPEVSRRLKAVRGAGYLFEPPVTRG
jgi:two-component system, OmpR family, response regulator